MWPGIACLLFTLGLSMAGAARAEPMTVAAAIRVLDSLARQPGPFSEADIERLFAVRLTDKQCWPDALASFFDKSEPASANCLARASLAAAEGTLALQFNWTGSAVEPFMHEGLMLTLPAAHCLPQQTIAELVGKRLVTRPGMPPTIFIVPGDTAPAPRPPRPPDIQEFQYSGHGKGRGAEPWIYIALHIEQGCTRSLNVYRASLAQLKRWSPAR